MAPTLAALPLRVGGLPSALVAAGAHSAAVLSEHGRILDELELPVRSLNSAPPQGSGQPFFSDTAPAQLTVSSKPCVGQATSEYEWQGCSTLLHSNCHI